MSTEEKIKAEICINHYRHILQRHANLTYSSDLRELVAERYHESLAEHAQNPDRVFFDASSLRDLDPNLVTFNDELREHPRSWTKAHKVVTTVLLSGYCSLPPFASTIFAPSLLQVMKELDITSTTLGALQVSIFLFAFSIGPLVLAPLSEIHGRTIILHVGNIIFIAFTIGCAVSQTSTQLAICRFFSGLGGSCGLAVLGGILSDIWDIKQRPKASGLVTLGPIIGPIIGPACGGWMSQKASWRWTCWVPAITAGVLQLVAFFFLRESYAPLLLKRKQQKVASANPGQPFYSVLDLQADQVGISRAGRLITNIFRPLVFLILDPALFAMALLYSIIFGDLYFLIVTYPDIFGTGYGHSEGIIGTDFLAIGVGILLGMFPTVKAAEILFARQSSPVPENRLLVSFPGILLATGGLFMYGFSALKTHFIIPLIGIAVYSAGVSNILIVIQLYSVDGFSFPASAFAAISILRCLFGGAFPLFGGDLFKALGVGWGVGLMAFLTIGICLPLTVIVYVFGKKLRNIGARNIAWFEGRKV